MNFIDYVCPAALSVGFIAAVPWGRKVWWLVDSCATGLFGLGLMLVPQLILGFQVTKGLDDVHVYLCRLIGAFLIGTAVSWYLSKDTIDLRMYGTQFFCRIIGCFFLLIAQFYSAYHLWKRTGMRYNEKFLLFSCVGVFLWLLGTSIQLLRYKDIGGYVYKPSWLHTGFLLDHMALLLIGVVDFAFPSQWMKLVVKSKYTIDGVHVCLVRTLASLAIATSLTSNSATGFLYAADKKAHVLGRLTTHTLFFAANVYAHFVQDLFTMFHVTPFMLSGFYITFVLSLYFRFGKEKEK